MPRRRRCKFRSAPPLISNIRRAAQHHDAARLDCACVACEGLLLTCVRDILWALRKRVDRCAPDALGHGGHFEVERLPEHVHHDVQVFGAVKSGDRARERARLRVVEARAIELGAVPGDVGQSALVDRSAVEVRLR